MKKVLISPSKYVQGEGEYNHLNDYFLQYGKKIFFIAHIDDKNRVQCYLDRIFEKNEIQLVFGDFEGECTLDEINKLSEQARVNQCEAVAGLGGGKALDTAKAVGFFIEKPVIILPTIASTDAPCSHSAVLYTKDGQFDRYMSFKKNPDLVLVDSQIIANAPVRFLVAGIGDALSTYFEARACQSAFANNIPGGKSTKAALAIARQCYDTLMEDAVKAKKACECNVVTPALENIVEANILLSGLGFESSGLAAAHSVHDGLTVLEETHHYFHGEKVSFGTIVQLVMENAPTSEINEVLELCKSVGLPICLADIGIVDVTQEKIKKVSIAACAEGETIGNMPFEVTPDVVAAAIFVADKLGQMCK
jgi:glycerol dehydrogenase